MTHMTVTRVRIYIVYRLNIWTSKYPGNKHSKTQFAHTNVSATLTWLSGAIFTYFGWSNYKIWSTFGLQTIGPLWRNFSFFLFAFELPYWYCFTTEFLDILLLYIGSKTWKCTLCLLRLTQFTPMLYTFVFSFLSM